MTTHLLLLLLVSLSVVSVSKPSFAVFVNIDCGASHSYVDENSIEWVGDDGYVQTGESRRVDSIYAGRHVFDTLRVFRILTKNCYTINNLNKGERVLMRASFLYGNYDGKHSPPTFDILLDGNRLGPLNLKGSRENDLYVLEVIYTVNGNSTSICFAQTLPDQLPFISALALQSLGSKMYSHAGSNVFLLQASRVALGAKRTIRYPVDPYNRIWLPARGSMMMEEVSIEAAAIDASTAEDQPPEVVVRNAIVGKMALSGPDLVCNGQGEFKAYINLYFSEVIQLKSTQKRSVQIYIDDEPYLDPIVPPFGSVLEVHLNFTSSSKPKFIVGATSDSTLPPLLNAYEVFQVINAPPYRTNSKDVEGLVALQTAFGILKYWTGDPCLPLPYSWEWIKCSTTANPRVIELNLSSIGLSGALPDFSSMDALQTIDLHNNNFHGPIPEFFGSFPNLKLLDLENNSFTGYIPTSILEKKGLKLVITSNIFDEMSHTSAAIAITVITSITDYNSTATTDYNSTATAIT